MARLAANSRARSIMIAHGVRQHHHQCARGRDVVTGDRRVGDRGYGRAGRRELVGVPARHQNREQTHRDPDCEKSGTRDEAEVKSRDHQQMRHAGEREGLAQVFIDTAAVADDQRAHLDVGGISQIGVDELADSLANRFDCRGGKEILMTNNRDRRRRFGLGRSDEHRRFDTLAKKPGAVVEFARIAVVARETQSARDPNLVADSEVICTDDRDSHESRRRRQ